METLTQTENGMNTYQWQLGLLARQCAREANRNPTLNDLADLLFTAAKQAGLPEHLLPR